MEIARVGKLKGEYTDNFSYKTKWTLFHSN